MSAPLAIDLCCGLGGWTEGLLAEGWRVRGYDIEAHEYGDERYPAELVLRNVLKMHGSEIADADLIVASPPCTEYSYMAMPWKRAKQIARALRGEDEFPEPYRGSRTVTELNAIFDACFRLQREASAVAGRHIPMIVENVRGAEAWVGRAAWNYGSFYLWGDLPALMPRANTLDAVKVPGVGAGWRAPGHPDHQPGLAFNPAAQGTLVRERLSRRRTDPGKGARFTSRDCGVEAQEGRKGAGAGAGAEWFDKNLCQLSSKSHARKAASTMIAKIPLALSTHIARVYKPRAVAA